MTVADAEAVGDRAGSERADRVPERERRRVPAHHRAGAPAAADVDRDGEVDRAEAAEREAVDERDRDDGPELTAREPVPARRDDEQREPEQLLDLRAGPAVSSAARHARRESHDPEERAQRADRGERV